jgi:hypothetical protein
MAPLLALFLLVCSTQQAQTPIEWSHLDYPDGRWVCDLVRDWKAIMHRDYPDADRSIPTVERRCHLPREHV